jgi:hypothetical protein
MHGEVCFVVKNIETGAYWSKGDRPIDYGSREAAQDQVDFLNDRQYKKVAEVEVIRTSY